MRQLLRNFHLRPSMIVVRLAIQSCISLKNKPMEFEVVSMQKTKETGNEKSGKDVNLHERRRSQRSFQNTGLDIKESESDSSWAAFNEFGGGPFTANNASAKQLNTDVTAVQAQGLVSNGFDNQPSVANKTTRNAAQVKLALKEIRSKHVQIAKKIEATWGQQACVAYMERLLIDGHDKADESNTANLEMAIIKSLMDLMSHHP